MTSPASPGGGSPGGTSAGGTSAGEASAGEASSGGTSAGGASAGGASARGLSQLGQGEFDLAQSVGGVRGLLESIAPGLVFVVVFVATRELSWALIGAVGLALVAAVSRLIARSSLNYVLGGLVGVGIGTIWAWRTGQAEDFFVWGLYVNAFGVLLALASIIARWPLVGVIVGTLIPSLGQWRQDRYARRLLTWATWLWVILFGLRLAVQVPLYINAQVGWLGTARLVMGVPLWAIILYLTWLLVHPVIRRAKAAGEVQRAEAERSERSERSDEPPEGHDERSEHNDERSGRHDEAEQAVAEGGDEHTAAGSAGQQAHGPQTGPGAGSDGDDGPAQH